MGQYYKPINLDKDEFLYSHDYENGLKLMEHSWIGNNFIAAVENLIKRGGAWFGDRIVWAGDYADSEPIEDETIPENERPTLYSMCNDEKKIRPENKTRDNSLRYLKNLDTKEFVDLKKVPISDIWVDEETNTVHKFYIHPLPLLTCEGNGRGGGDFHGESPLIGKWSRNRITIQKSKPKNCKEIMFDLKE